MSGAMTHNNKNNYHKSQPGNQQGEQREKQRVTAAEYVSEHFSFLLSSGISEESMEKYIDTIYNNLLEAGYDAQTLKYIVKEIMNTIFQKTDNYETFVRALLNKDDDASNFFLEYIGKAIKEMDSSDIVEKNKEAFYNEDIFGRGSKMQQGYFISSLLEAKKRYEEERVNYDDNEEVLARIDEKIMRIDSILGIVNQKMLEYRREHEKVNLQDCYIGSVSFKIDRIKEEIAREAASQIAKEIVGQLSAFIGSGDRVEQASQEQVMRAVETIDYTKISQIVSESERVQRIETLLLENFDNLKSSIESLHKTFSVLSQQPMQSVQTSTQTPQPSIQDTEKLDLLNQGIMEILKILQNLEKNTNSGAGVAAGDEVGTQLQIVVESTREILEAVRSSSQSNANITALKSYFDEKFEQMMSQINRTHDLVDRVNGAFEEYVRKEEAFIEDMRRK